MDLNTVNYKMACDLNQYNKCDSKTFKKIDTLDWACPIVAYACKQSAKHKHTLCNKCLNTFNLQLDILKKR